MAPVTTASEATESISPNQTLYVTNLSDKLQKHDLRRALYMLFSTYGPVIDVIALKTMKMRGQAHIVFRDVQTSTQAMRALQAFNFFGKEMKITYAKGRSDTIAKLEAARDGTFVKATVPTTTVSTDLQKSIFNAPPSSLPPKPTSGTPAGHERLAVPLAAAPTNGIAAAAAPAQNAPSPTQGEKRKREEESDEEGDAPMDEDEDAMEESEGE